MMTYRMCVCGDCKTCGDNILGDDVCRSTDDEIDACVEAVFDVPEDAMHSSGFE